MKVFVLAKDTADIPKDVAHLYEHWFIASFYHYAEQALHIHGGTAGYIGGNTFSNMIFIEAWLYDPQLAELFGRFIAQETLYDNLLPACLQQCQAEDRVTWGIQHPAKPHEQLGELRKLPWQNEEDIAPFAYDDSRPKRPSPIATTKSAASYRAVTILANIEHASLEERALFVRLSVILTDILGAYIQQKGWYQLDALPARENELGMYCIASASLPQGTITNAHIKAEVENYLKDYDLAANMHLILAHFAEFASQPLWKGRIREDLHNFPIVAGNRQIAELATQERIQGILEKVDITLETVSYAFAKDLKY